MIKWLKKISKEIKRGNPKRLESWCKKEIKSGLPVTRQERH